MEREIQSQEKSIQRMEKVIQRMEKWYNERVGKLLKEVDLETLYRLHYQQVLTVTRLIVLFEENFRVSILKIFRASVLKDLSRLEKWSAYLQYKNENFKPFQEAGFTVDQVSNLVDSIFKPHLMDIHSIKLVEGLLFRTRGTFTADQMKVLKIIVEESSWKDVVSIE